MALPEAQGGIAEPDFLDFVSSRERVRLQQDEQSADPGFRHNSPLTRGHQSAIGIGVQAKQKGTESRQPSPLSSFGCWL